jgi:hypothetical protein
MTKRLFSVFFIVFFTLILINISFAQEQTGSIVGKIVDRDNEPLPGASVTLTGSSMMGTRSFVSTKDGDFRFPAVPPGRDYIITVEMTGFQKTQKTGIIVAVGENVPMEIQVLPMTQEEEITVTAAAPTVDIKSTKHSVTYTSDLINHIPLARDYHEIIQSIPGITAKDSSYDGFGAHGENSKKSMVAIDGVGITDPTQGTTQIGISFDIFEEFEMQIGSLPANVGVTSGAYVNIVTKSGGNNFSGTANIQWFNKDLSSPTVTQEEANALGISVPSGRKANHDYSFSLGGPIAKDKIWFFLNGRIFGFADDANSLEGAYEVKQDEIMAFSKLTFQLHPNLKLTGMFSLRNWDKPLSPAGIFRSKYSGVYTDNAQDIVSQGQLNWILNQNSFLNLRISYQKKFNPYLIHPELESASSYDDRFTSILIGPSVTRNYEFNVPKMGTNLAFTYFWDDFLGGDHEIKMGLEYETASTLIPFWRDNPFTQFKTYDGSIYGYKDVNPIMGHFVAGLWGMEKGDWETDLNVKRYAAYFQDSLTFKNRVTLNLGIRYDESHGHAYGGTYLASYAADPVLSMLNPDYAQPVTFPDVKDLMVWKDLSPRLGLVFDVFGDQTTALKASWASYNDDLEMGRLMPLAPSGSFGKYCIARWIDTNRNEQLDLTDRYLVLQKPQSPEEYSDPKSYIDPDLKSPKTQEIMVGIERELFKNVRVSATYIHKTLHNHIDTIEKLRGYREDSEWWVPYTTVEPGWDGEFGTSDDQQITIYGEKKGAPESVMYYQNIPEAKRTYDGVDFVLRKRMSDGWQFLGSVTLSRLYGNTGEGFQQSIGTSSAFDTPNWFVNREGLLSWDRPLVIKLQGSVILPYDLVLSGYYKYQSGTPWGRTIAVQLPPSPDFEYPGNFVSVLAEPPDSYRTRARNSLDLRLEKGFRFGNTAKLDISADAVNVLGESFYSVVEDPGGRLYANGNFIQWPNYGVITNVTGMRVFKLNLRFSF